MDILSPLAVAIGLSALALAFLIFTFARSRRRAVARVRASRERDGVHGQGMTASAVHRGTSRTGGPGAGMKVCPLAPGQRDLFIRGWLSIQAHFTHDPQEAVRRAGVLVEDILTTRGYPVGRFSQRYDELSVEQAEVMADFRTAQAIAHQRSFGEKGVEQNRRAITHYRALFDDLVNEPEEFSPVIANRGGRIHDLRKEPTRRG